MNPIQELILKMADDALIYGHRNSEWTGLGPTLEEDISFSSIAQDKVGHAWQLYQILENNFGMHDPDELAFKRDEKEMKCSHFVEIYTQDYAFALVRHFFFDHAEFLRYSMLQNSRYEPLAQLAKKIKGEIKYHLLHADTWMQKLGTSTEESKARMQGAVNEAFPFALGLFEKGDHEAELKEQHVFEGEEALRQQWLDSIFPIVRKAGLSMPEPEEAAPKLGGRNGYHTEFLQPLLNEMGEVLRSEPDAKW